MSLRTHLVLFRPSHFELSWLQRLLVNAQPLDRTESFEHARLRDGLHAARYVPPARKSPSARWAYGLEYFTETLSSELANLGLPADSSWELVLFSWDDSQHFSSVWRIGSAGEDRRWIGSDGVGSRERIDEQGEQHTTSSSVRVPAGTPEKDVDTVQARLEAPYAAEPLLNALFGLTVPELLALEAAARWEPFWPARATKKPATKKPAAKKRVSDRRSRE